MWDTPPDFWPDFRQAGEKRGPRRENSIIIVWLKRSPVKKMIVKLFGYNILYYCVLQIIYFSQNFFF
jgi:hypothetical protein